MIKCPKCGNKMNKICHFEKGKSYVYHSCKKCITNTHTKRIHFDEFESEEHLLKINKSRVG